MLAVWVAREAEGRFMRFGLYLKGKGIVTADQLVAALEVQQAKKVPIGQLAIEEGILTARQVFTILCSQTDAPHERFGEAAIDLGLMTREQLLKLLVLQMDRNVSLREVLIQQRAITAAQAESELAEFRRMMEGRARVIKRPIQVAPRKTAATLFREAHMEGLYASGI
jgi:hypothetical protein